MLERLRQLTATKTNPRSFDAWLPAVTPSFCWDWPHLCHVRAQLARITSGELRRLMLFLPPRHGKSEMVTVRYPVWRLERDPALRVIVAAYNQTLADKFSRKSRRLARERFPLSDERQSAEDWETPQGGGLRAVGVGAGITGQGGNLIIIDDPVKSREEANSPTYRERVYDWYTDDLSTRMEPGAAIVLIQTRWHEDDLAGRILASDDGPNWTVVSLPAEAETQDPLGREIGAALCPERYPLPELAKIKTTLGSYAYAALYQQRPLPLEGGMFKRAWFPIVESVTPRARRVRYWDKAATEDGGCFTVGTLLAFVDGAYYVEDVVRGQWSMDERERRMVETTQADAQRYRFSSYRVKIEAEGGSAGKDMTRRELGLLSGFNVRHDHPTGPKESRWLVMQGPAEAGTIRLVRGPWNDAWLDEMCSLPLGKYKDQADSVSGAFADLALQARGFSVQER